MSKKVEDLLPELASLIEHQEKKVESISHSTIGWQIDHSLKVINSVCNVAPDSIEEKYKPKQNFSKLFVMTTGYIPRGNAKAPKFVTSDSVSKEDLHLQHHEALQNLKKLEQLKPNQYFSHPLFGHLNAKALRKFLYIHTYHHLKIMRDILKA